MPKRKAITQRQHSIEKKRPDIERIGPELVKKGRDFDGFFRRHHWLCAAALILLLVGGMTIEWNPLSFRPFTGPFNGLHSWARASGAWAARSHANYGLGYTKGFTTWALGDPPTENPKRYVDHPQLPTIMLGGAMAVLGVNDRTPRLMRIITSALGLLLLLKVVRGLFDAKTAVLAGTMFAVFPLTCYFGSGGWVFVVSMWAIWRYLILIGELPGGPKAKTRHLVELAIALFLVVQLTWAGTFYAFTIGLHYVSRCVFRRTKPRPALLAVLLIMPLMSLSLNFVVMAAGYEWDTQKIVELYKWRSAKGERNEFNWSAWLAKIHEFAVSNFTWPVLILLFVNCVYLVVGRVVLFYHGSERVHKNKGRKSAHADTQETSGKTALTRSFRQIWLFLLPGVFMLLLLKGLVWEHQYWQRPLAAFVAIGAALGLLLIGDVMGRIHRFASTAVVLSGVLLIVIFCAQGLAAYRKVVWQSPRTIELFQKLNKQIPPEKALLTFKDFVIKQHPSKGSFYRPEYAWYLDREMIVARSAAQIDEMARTGRFPYYFIPAADQPLGGARIPEKYRKHFSKLSNERLVELSRDPSNKMLADWQLRRRFREGIIEWMKQKYHYEYFDNPAAPGQENYCNRGNTPCYIFDLNRPKTNAAPIPNENIR